MRRKGRIVTTVAVCAATVALTAIAIALAPDTSSESNTAAVPTSTTTATASSESFAFTPNADVPSNGHPIEATITEEPKNADMAPSDIPADSPHPDRDGGTHEGSQDEGEIAPGVGRQCAKDVLPKAKVSLRFLP